MQRVVLIFDEGSGPCSGRAPAPPLPVCLRPRVARDLVQRHAVAEDPEHVRHKAEHLGTWVSRVCVATSS